MIPDTAVPARLVLLLRALPRALVPTVAVIALCAAATTWLLHIGDGYPDNLKTGLCIGLIGTLLVNGARLALWGEEPPPVVGFLALVAVGAPVSALAGRLLADRWRGLPLTWLPTDRGGWMIGTVVLTTLLCAGVARFYRNRARLMQQLAQAQTVERLAVQTQLGRLQAQLDAHLLFDTLTALQPLIGAEPLRARQMLDQLIQTLGATVATAHADSTTLHKEFDLIKAYLGLMSLRMGMHLSYTLQLPEELGRLRLAPMLLQPLVENAIRHGLEPKTGGGNCTVRAARHKDMLVLSVFDTGVGLSTHVSFNKPSPQAELAALTGKKEPGIGLRFGLDHIRERLEALYGPTAELILTHNVPAGTMAQITIPLKALQAAHRSGRAARRPAA